MSQTESNSLTNTTPHSKPTTLQPQASTSSNPKMHKPLAILADEAEKMPAYNPIEIGTRGTVGSLVMKEIEYFNQLELSTRSNDTPPNKPSRSQATHTNTMASSSGGTNPSKPCIGSAPATQQQQQQKKKKRGVGGGNRLLPSMCSMVEVSEHNRNNNNNNNSRSVGASGFGYRNLKADVKNLQA